MKYKTPYTPTTDKAPESGTYRPNARRSPELARAVQAVYDDVHNKISDPDREFLENDAILWLRALRLVAANIDNALHMRSAELDAIKPGSRVLLVDDLLATGGTSAAAAALVKKLGGNILEAAFLIELKFLNGREKLAGIPIRSLVAY